MATKLSASTPGVSDLLQQTPYGKEGVKAVVDGYVDLFDASKGNDADTRKDNYETLVNSYYDLAT